VPLTLLSQIQPMLDIHSKVATPKKLPTDSPESFYKLPDLETKPSLRRRLVIGGSLVAIGLGVVGFGIASIVYRMTHLTVNNGLLNGRQVRLQAPINGEIKDFFARPGVAVQKGQVLARLAPSQQQEQLLLQAH
jgi:multidrug efflux pump subunit AcrA (membrane-fusion protein)